MTYIERIINLETGETTERPYTAEEIADVEARQTKAQDEVQAEATKAAAKVAATAKLAALGLTEDDLKALGLGNN